MKNKLHFVLILIFMPMISGENFGIVVHGGAGVMSTLTQDQQDAIKLKVSETLISSYKILKNGGSSLDAVEFAVSEFEMQLSLRYLNLKIHLYLMLARVQFILQTKLKKWMLQLCSD